MESAPKRQRIGVGSSVTTLLKGPADDFLLILAKTTVSRLVPNVQSIVVARRSDTAATVFRSMVDNNILSVVVLTKQEKMHGFIEISDIVQWIVRLYRDLPLDELPDYSVLASRRPSFEKVTVSDLIPAPRGTVNPYHPIQKDYSLLYAWEVLARSGVHRVPIVDNNFILWDLVTQSMLVDFLWQNIEKIGNLSERPLGTVFGKSDQVVCSVSQKSAGIVAFRIMYEAEVHGLAVVDARGKLVDNISERDLRVIYAQSGTFEIDKLKILWDKTVEEIKDLNRVKYPSKTPKDLLFVTASDSFYSLIEKLATRHVHRVFMVDSKETMIPIRCISQTDVLLAILKCYT